MAAAQASPHSSAANCQDCGRPDSGSFIERHVCEGCGKPRPLGKDETFFEALGVPEKFAQDAGELQRRFYQASRALHPDRFGTADAVARQRSLERMSFLNEAYATLRDPEALRGYVLMLHGFKSEAAARGQVPAELAELWFELQEDLSEKNVATFRSELMAGQEKLDAKIVSIQRRLDQLDSASAEYRTGLEELVQANQQKNYLKSMNRDLESRIARQVSG